MLAIARTRAIYDHLAQADVSETGLIGYHPHFIMTAGMPTHFDRSPGEPVAIETYVHLTLAPPR